MSSLDFYTNINGPAATQHCKDFLITYIDFHGVLCIPVIYVFQRQFFWTLLHTVDSIHHITLYIAYILNIFFWTIYHLEITLAVTAPGPVFSTTSDSKGINSDTTTTG